MLSVSMVLGLFPALIQNDPTPQPRDLVVKLRSEKVDERDEASEKLLLLGEKARTALQAIENDSDREVAARARDLLARLDLRRRLGPALLEAISDIDRRLAGRGDKDWTAVLLEVTEQKLSRRRFPKLRSEDVDVLAAPAMRGAEAGQRARLVRLVGRWHLSSAIPEVAKLLADPEQETRRAAVEALREFHARSAGPALIAALGTEKEPWILGDVIDLLGNLEIRESAGEIWRLLKVQKGNDYFKTQMLEALSSIGNDEIIPGLLALSKERDSFLGTAELASTLARLNVDKSIALLTKEIEAADEDGRIHPLYLLLSLPSPKVLPIARELLKDKDHRVRYHAQSVFVTLQSKEAIPLLRESLNHEDRWTRFGAARTLASLGDSSALPVFLKELDDFQLRETVLMSLSSIDAREAFPKLMEFVKSGDSRPVFILVRQGGEEWISKILPLATNGSKPFKNSFGHSLAAVGSKEAIPLLTPSLKDPDHNIHYQAAESLGAMGLPESLDALLEAARFALEKESCSHYPAIRYLGRVGGKKAIPYLETLLDHKESGARREALIALEEAGAVELLDRARALLTEDDGGVRMQAATWLTRSGSREGVPMLLAWRVNLFALNAIRRPDLWKTFSAVKFKRPLQDWGLRGLEEIADAAKLKLALDEDIGGAWPSLRYGARTPLEAFEQNGFILEDGILRVPSKHGAIGFWREWWTAEAEKERKTRADASAQAPAIGSTKLPRLGGRQVAPYRCTVDLHAGKVGIDHPKDIDKDEEAVWNDLAEKISRDGHTFQIIMEDNQKTKKGGIPGFPDWVRVSLVEIDDKTKKVIRTIPIQEFQGEHERHGPRALILKDGKIRFWMQFWVDD